MEGRRLSLWFKGGIRYIDLEVPATSYEKLCAASSAGKYFCERIKERFTRSWPKPRVRFED